jgi:hypothetical protein
MATQQELQVQQKREVEKKQESTIPTFSDVHETFVDRPDCSPIFILCLLMSQKCGCVLEATRMGPTTQ